VSLFLHPCGRSNGTSFDSAGNLWTCADNKNELWEIAVASRVVTDVVTNFRGQLLNGPNDVWINPKSGGMYLTDPYYVRPYWQRGPMEQPGQNVLYLAPDHKTLSLAITDMQQPNGIIGTPDGKTLYVSDIRGGKTFAYTIEKDGTLTHERLFCKLGSDGMTIDSAGNVYCTGHGVTVFDKTGAQIAHIPIDEGWTGNICFGGSDRKTLFITATTSIYLLRMQVHGVGSQ
jgi:gluconolactonase